ncbi:hypothetical protein GUJ93_ZPchr0001g33062 [Zizania palustris]|uniref:Uncharacterized protein n=1 Tax=Zizania palustris TaxID=103762 RepID=A0A8J5V9D0_ZIZPA|nr:hypothetical protein GUJ93_ZPchr0001g33062 [Zizania palustris]
MILALSGRETEWEVGRSPCDDGAGGMAHGYDELLSSRLSHRALGRQCPLSPVTGDWSLRRQMRAPSKAHTAASSMATLLHRQRAVPVSGYVFGSWDCSG